MGGLSVQCVTEAVIEDDRLYPGGARQLDQGRPGALPIDQRRGPRPGQGGGRGIGFELSVTNLLEEEVEDLREAFAV